VSGTARDFDREDTRRTTLARTALEMVGETRGEMVPIKRTVRALKWWRLAFVIALGLVATGWALAEKANHFATKSETDDHRARIEMIEKHEEARDSHIRDLNESFKRLADSVDRFTDNMISRERRNGK
jgi:hypothetical protein